MLGNGFGMPPGPRLSGSNPLADGVASPGSTGLAADAGHVHPAFGLVLVVGAPNTRTLTAATAYQATDTSKPAVVTFNVTSVANLSLSGGQTHSADIVIGSTSAVAGGTGTVIGKYSNSSTGTLTIGLNTNTASAVSFTAVIPAGWYFAWRITSGTVTMTSAFDQSVG